MGFSRWEYWNAQPFLFPGDLPNAGIELRSSALQADSLSSEPAGPDTRVTKGLLTRGLISVAKVSHVNAQRGSLKAEDCVCEGAEVGGRLAGLRAATITNKEERTRKWGQWSILWGPRATEELWLLPWVSWKYWSDLNRAVSSPDVQFGGEGASGKGTRLASQHTGSVRGGGPRPSWLASRQGFPGGSAVKNPPANAGDVGLIPGPGRSPGEGNGNPLHHPCLGNPTDRGAWRATVCGVTKSQTRLSDWITAAVETMRCWILDI